MKGCNITCEVERFVLSEIHLELDGWIVSDSPIEWVRLVSAGIVLPVGVNPQADDADRRLLLSLRETASSADGFVDAVLEIAASNGDRLSLDVGHLFRPPGWAPAIVDFDDPDAALPIPAASAAALANAIADGLRAFADRDDFFMHRGDSGWIATSHRYGLDFPVPLDVPPDRYAARDEAWPLLRARRGALLDLTDRLAPMVIHRRTVIDTDDDMTALLHALRTRNPDIVLLWIDTHRDAGPVIRHRAGAIAPPDPALLVASARIDHEVMLDEAIALLTAAR